MVDRRPYAEYQPHNVRAEQARERGKQLAERQSQLRTGKPVTQADVDIAARRARSALLHASAAHERAAVLHDRAADHDGPDEVAHRDAAIWHRDAGDEDLRSAFNR